MIEPLQIGLMMQGSRDWIGGTEYIKNLILALGSLPDEIRSTFELSLICSKSIDTDLHNQISPYLDRIYYLEGDLKPATIANRLRWKLIRTFFDLADPRLDAFVKKVNFDFVYPYLTQGKRQLSCHSAAWIPDLQYKYLPQFFSTKELQIREQTCSKIAKYAKTVVLSSQSAASDLQKFYPNLEQNRQILSFKSSSLPEWYQPNPQQIQAKYSLGDRFFLISNQFWQHKNHLTVFAALKILKAQAIYPTIVCTGLIYDRRQPDYGNTIVQAIQDLEIQQQVHLLNLIPKIDQVQLIRRCLAVIQPSLFEGWSTIVEEARVLGKPIILSDLPVHLEQNPPNSAFFERNSPESLAALLGKWWQNLHPGPNLEQEASSKTNSRLEVQNFGGKFLAIAQGVCNGKSTS